MWAPTQPSSISPPTIFFMVTQSNKCAVCSVTPHHDSDKVTWFGTSPSAKVTPLFLCLSPAVTKRGEGLFIFCQSEIFSDKAITSSPSPFERLTMCLKKGSDKGAQAAGVDVVVVLILRVAIDECQFTASGRLFLPLSAADLGL